MRAAETLGALRQGIVHLTITEEEPGSTSNEFPRRYLFDDPLVTLARMGHPVHQANRALYSYANCEHIIATTENDSDNAGLRLAIALREKGGRIQTTASVFGALLRASERDILVTAPESSALMLANKLGLVLVAQPFETAIRPIHLVWHRSFDRDECHRWIREAIASTASELDADRHKERNH